MRAPLVNLKGSALRLWMAHSFTEHSRESGHGLPSSILHDELKCNLPFMVYIVNTLIPHSRGIRI